MTPETLAALGAQLRTCLLCGGPPHAIGVFIPTSPLDLYHMLNRADVRADGPGTGLAYALCAAHYAGGEATAAQVEAVLRANRMGTFHITYATGRQFSLTGEFRVMEPFPGSVLLIPCVITNGTAQALDPRAVVRDHAGLVLFTGCSTAQLEADLARRRGAEVWRGAGKTTVVVQS